MRKHRDVAAFILAGGKSSRMGCDKALIEMGGVPMIMRAARLTEPIVGRVAIVGPPARYTRFGYDVFADEWPDAGPLGGIATALRHSETEWNLVLACDLPYLTGKFLAWLIARGKKSTANAVLPDNANGPEPLCAMYRRRAAASLALALDHGIRKITKGLETAGVELVSQEEWKAFDSDGRLFKNMNSTSDFEDAQAALPGGPSE